MVMMLAPHKAVVPAPAAKDDEEAPAEAAGEPAAKAVEETPAEAADEAATGA
jgi:hypothetical protein